MAELAGAAVAWSVATDLKAAFSAEAAESDFEPVTSAEPLLQPTKKIMTPERASRSKFGRIVCITE
jgi:hypothetical protein